MIMSVYDEALDDSGDPGQCPVIVGPYRCTNDRHHRDECASEDADGNPVFLGVVPVEESWSDV